MKRLFISLFLVSFVKIGAGASAEWCYQSQVTCDSRCKGPEQWHQIGSCAGEFQSPINIVTKRTLPDGRLTPFKFAGYQESFHSVIKNNGHSVHVAVPHQAKVSGGDLESTYKAVQFHLHWGKDGGPGSEHTVDGEQYPMELHIVHMKEKYTSLNEALKDKTGVAVLGFFYQESGITNKKYEPIITALKKIEMTHTNTTISDVSLDALIPSQNNMTNYYRYQGSLTTPDCIESVVWTVFEHPILLSKGQLDAFSKLRFANGTQMVNTFRPVQPLGKRMVYRSGSDVILASAALLVLSVLVSGGVSWPN